MFRSSRPDYIETAIVHDNGSFRIDVLFRSSRPDYIETDAVAVRQHRLLPGLFRSSRPDYIETRKMKLAPKWNGVIVPVFQTGLH